MEGAGAKEGDAGNLDAVTAGRSTSRGGVLPRAPRGLLLREGEGAESSAATMAGLWSRGRRHGSFCSCVREAREEGAMEGSAQSCCTAGRFFCAMYREEESCACGGEEEEGCGG